MKYIMGDTQHKQTNYQDGFIVRNRIKKTRFYTDNEFLEKDYAAFLGRRAEIYYCLVKHANSETQTCWPSYQTIMKETGIKDRNVIVQTLNALQYLKLIAIKGPPLRKSNTYYILSHLQWRELTSIARNTAKAVLKMTRKEYLNWREAGMPLNTLNQRIKSDNEIKNINNNKNDNGGFKHISNFLK